MANLQDICSLVDPSEAIESIKDLAAKSPVEINLEPILKKLPKGVDGVAVKDALTTKIASLKWSEILDFFQNFSWDEFLKDSYMKAVSSTADDSEILDALTGLEEG